MYHVYILTCSDGTFYTGISNKLEKRIQMHNGIIRGGAKYTQGRRPVFLSYKEECSDRSSATKRELQIKKLSREEKKILINSYKT